MSIINPPTWEDVRARILKAIEEEKRANAKVRIPSASMGTYSLIFQGEEFYSSTANEDSYGFPPKTSSAVEGLP